MWPVTPKDLLRNSRDQIEWKRRTDGRLLHGLAGDVVKLSSWTCKDQCKPPHEMEEQTPGVNPICVEHLTTGTLERRVELDIKCLGYNESEMDISCGRHIPGFDEEEGDSHHGETWAMFDNCDQDPDLLFGECGFVCRFGQHLTQRCNYKFDRIKKYHIHGDVFHHCKLLAWCEDNSTVEQQAMFCNRSAVEPEITRSPAEPPVKVEESSMMIMVLLIVLIAVVVMGCTAVLFCLWRRTAMQAKASTNPTANAVFGGMHSTPSSTDGGDNPDEAVVVVGRPVEGAVAPPAAAGAAAPPPKGNQKGSEI